ncbi:putative gluconokinase isoform X4 [Centroberyx gerrardi]
MIYIIMGVSGCGKSTLGTFLSEKLGWPLYEGDNFHPKENIEKMSRGEPLTDQRIYRQILLYGSKALPSSSSPDQEQEPLAIPDVFFLFLYGDYDFIHQRMVARRGHFMSEDLLRSQFDVLEPPLDEENVLPLDIRRSVPEIAMEIETHYLSRNQGSRQT